MASVVDICNIALSNLGDQKISSLSDANERARVCHLRHEDVRDSVLRSHPWSCAIKRTQLARNDTAPVWGFDYAYSLPSDCLRVLDVEEWETPFRIENGNIVTDAEKVKLKYIKQVWSNRYWSSWYEPVLVGTQAQQVRQRAAFASNTSR